MMKSELLLKLARESIRAEFDGKNIVIEEKIKKEFSEKKACFVTLTINGHLRGCIGSILPRQELWREVVENAKNAAFRDPRFYSLTKDEFEKIKIEVSILSLPKNISYKSFEDLKRKIKGKGVILSYGFHSATYLPQVWEELSNPEEFLSSLCLKAGLPANFWKEKDLKIQTYSVERIRE